MDFDKRRYCSRPSSGHASSARTSTPRPSASRYGQIIAAIKDRFGTPRRVKPVVVVKWDLLDDHAIIEWSTDFLNADNLFRADVIDELRREIEIAFIKHARGSK